MTNVPSLLLAHLSEEQTCDITESGTSPTRLHVDKRQPNMSFESGEPLIILRLHTANISIPVSRYSFFVCFWASSKHYTVYLYIHPVHLESRFKVKTRQKSAKENCLSLSPFHLFQLFHLLFQSAVLPAMANKHLSGIKFVPRIINTRCPT